MQDLLNGHARMVLRIHRIARSAWPGRVSVV